MSDGKLKELLKKEHIRVHVKADNWESAVRIGGGILVQNGCVEESFVEAALQRIKTMGPYMVIYTGLGIHHGSSEGGVEKLGLSLITLEEPASFGSPYNDPVKSILCIAPVDTTSHLKILTGVVEMIQDGSIDDNENVQEIDEIIRSIH